MLEILNLTKMSTLCFKECKTIKTNYDNETYFVYFCILMLLKNLSFTRNKDIINIVAIIEDTFHENK